MDKNIAGNPAPEGPRKRRSPRKSLRAEVQLRRSGHHHYIVNVYDISPEGCRIEFVDRPRLDETVWVKFDGLDAIESVVCWLKGADAGVEFARPIYPAVFDMLVRRLGTRRSPSLIETKRSFRNLIDRTPVYLWPTR